MSAKLKKAILYWKTMSWSALMLIIFLMPANNLSKAPSVPGLSELVHVIMFAVFSWLFLYDLKRSGSLGILGNKKYLTVILFGLSFGILIEYLQKASNLGRTAEFSDLIFDLVGCFLSLGILLIYFRVKAGMDSRD